MIKYKKLLIVVAIVIVCTILINGSIAFNNGNNGSNGYRVSIYNPYTGTGTTGIMMDYTRYGDGMIKIILSNGKEYITHSSNVLIEK